MWGLLAGAMLSLAQAKTTYSNALSVEEQQQFLYYFYEAQRLLQKQDISTAWELVQFCHELNPNDATINNYMGVFLCSFDRSDEALPYLQRAFELQPNEYWYDYAVYLLRCNDKKLEKIAIRNLETVARNNPKNEEVHTLLQKAYIHYNNDYKRALLVQNRLDSILGYNAMSAMQRYQLNVMDNNPKRAIYEVERYLDEEPNDMQFQLFRMQLYEQTNQPSKKLIKAYHAVLPYQPRNWVLLNNLAWHLCITKQDLKQAEQLSRATIMAQPNNPIYLDTYAWILFQLGQYNDALFYIQQAIDNIDIKTKNIDLEAETNDLDPETYKEIQHHYKAILKKAKK
jgi:predicted Zn-dependent protease